MNRVVQYILSSRKRIFLTIYLMVSLCLGMSFYKENARHDFFEKYGVVTKVDNAFQPSEGSYFYYFTSKEGRVYKKSGKCIDSDYFDKNYKNADVIYDPASPQHHMLLNEHQRFSVTFKLIYYFLFVSPVLTFFLFQIAKKIQVPS